MNNINKTLRAGVFTFTFLALSTGSSIFGMQQNIWDAIKGNNINRVSELISQKGFDINQTTSLGITALIKAIMNKKTDIAKLLIAKGANVNKANVYGYTPLIIAVLKEENAIIKLLIEKGADVNKADNNGDTPLLWATFCKAPVRVMLLIQYGAYIDDKALKKAKENKDKFANSAKKEDRELYENSEKIFRLLELTKEFDSATNQKVFIDKYAKNKDIYDMLTNRWLNSKKQLTLFGAKMLEKYKDTKFDLKK